MNQQGAGVQSNLDKRNALLGKVAIVVVLVGVVLAAMWTSARSDSGNAGEAVAQCEGFADQRLKSPASADYDLGAVESDGRWTVTGTVDSQNSFGAMIRNDVECVIELDDNSARLVDLSLD